MKYVTNKMLEDLRIDSAQYVEWVENALSVKQKSLLPPKISIKQDGHRFFNVMPCIVPQLNIAGVKVVTRYPGREPSLKSELMLYSNDTGELGAILEADYITTWRTAAVAVHSIKLLARQDYTSIAFIGLGVIGQAALKVYIDTLDGRRVDIRIFNYKDRAQDIISKYDYAENIRFTIYDSYEEMITDCDVIVSAVTYAEKDFCDESLYKRGCLIVPIHTLGFQSCDLTFDKIFGDDEGHIKGFKYFDRFRSFHETSDILSGKCRGRENDSERIIAYNIGIALHDMIFAYELSKRIEMRSIDGQSDAAE